MSRILVAIAIDGCKLGPQAAKEAAAMALEALGGVQVLRVEEEEVEQLGFISDGRSEFLAKRMCI